MQGLGFLPGAVVPIGGANAVSADGSFVVGGSASASTVREAFIWDATHGMRGLGDLPGGDLDSDALGVSADGSVVVGVGHTSAGLEAFVWDAENGMRSLQVMLTSLGIDLTGWQLTQAVSVSADGSTIAGSALNPAGAAEAFIAVIPEPGTALLLGLSLLGLGIAGSTRSRSGAMRT